MKWRKTNKKISPAAALFCAGVFSACILFLGPTTVIADTICGPTPTSCPSQCPPGQHHPRIGGDYWESCVPDTEDNCNPGTHWNVNLARCIQDGADSCDAGQVFNGTRCVESGNVHSAIQGYTVTPNTELCNPLRSGTYKGCAYNILYDIILSPAALMLGVAGTLLDFVIETTIIGFSKFVKGGPDGAPGAIAIAWSLIRDVLNMTFIFMFLYISINTVLGTDKAPYQKLIPKIVFAGLVINFSFFFTSVLIDISNVAAVELHRGVVEIGNTQPSVGLPMTSFAIDGVSAAFMHGLRLKVTDDPDILRKIIILIVSFVVISAAAFLFFAMAAMLVVRYIVLIILLITSPIAVMGGILPQLSTQSSRWWKELTNQLIFAPVFMLFMLIVVLIINSTGFHSAIAGPASNASFFGKIAASLLSYGLVLGLMIAGLIASKQFAGSAGNSVTDWAEKKARSIARSPVTLGGIVARETIGGGAEWLGKKYDIGMGKLSQLSPADRGLLGKGAVYAGRAVAGIATKTRLDEGVRDTFKGIAGAKFGTSESRAEKKRALLERKKQLGQAVKESDQERLLREGLRETRNTVNTPAYDSTQLDSTIDKYVKEIGKLTDAKIEEMLSEDLEKLKDADFVGAFNARQLDVINKSTLISDADKDAIRSAHEKGLGARMGSTFNKDTKEWSAPTREREVDRILSGRPSDVAQLPPAILRNPNVARKLSSNVLSQIAHNAKMSDADRLAIRTTIETAEPLEVPTGADATTTTTINQANARLQKAKEWLAGGAGLAF